MKIPLPSKKSERVTSAAARESWRLKHCCMFSVKQNMAVDPLRIFSRACHPDHSLMKIKEVLFYEPAAARQSKFNFLCSRLIAVFDERSELTGCEGTKRLV